MKRLFTTLRICGLYVAVSALMQVSAAAAPAPAAPAAGCGDFNVCCGEVSDLTCVSYVAEALGNCCGSIGGNSSCWDGVFYVYCNGSGNYCECNSAGGSCQREMEN